MASLRRGGSRWHGRVGALVATLLLASCGAATAATGGDSPPAAATTEAPVPPTATAVSIAYVPPSVAKTVGASFALTPHPTATSTAIPTPTVVGTLVRFSSVEKILVGNCAGCHPPNQNMNLLTGHVYTSIVKVPSKEQSSLMRIKPGDPTNSYLYLKVSEARPPVGVRMPKDEPPLTADELTALRDWIEQGAKLQ